MLTAIQQLFSSPPPKTVVMLDLDGTLEILEKTLRRATSLHHIPNEKDYQNLENGFSSSTSEHRLLYKANMQLPEGPYPCYIPHAAFIYLVLLKIAADPNCIWCIITNSNYNQWSVINFLTEFMQKFTALVRRPDSRYYLPTDYTQDTINFISCCALQVIAHLFDSNKFSFYNNGNQPGKDPHKTTRLFDELDKHNKPNISIKLICVEDQVQVLKAIQAEIKKRTDLNFNKQILLLAVHMLKPEHIDKVRRSTNYKDLYLPENEMFAKLINSLSSLPCSSILRQAMLARGGCPF